MRKFKSQEVVEIDRELERQARYMRFCVSAEDEKHIADCRWKLLTERRYLTHGNINYKRHPNQPPIPRRKIST